MFCLNECVNLKVKLCSKFGTKVAYSLSANKEPTMAQPESPSACETEDDETDDEEQNPDPSIDPSVTSGSNIVKILDKNGSIVLPTLSLFPNHDEQPTTSYESQLTTVIQCGSVYFRVTRIPLNLCCSRLSPSDKKKVTNVAPSIGARIKSSFDLSTTHLVTPNRTFVAKLVCAWTLSIPAVTPSFVSAMSERNDPGSSLPNLNDHLAKGETQMDSLEYTPDEPKLIMSEFLVLSLSQTEAEMLCQCAGASIKKLYNEDGDKSFWQTDEYFQSLHEYTEDKGLKVVWIDTTSRTVKKGKEYLLKKTRNDSKDKSDFQLSCVTQSGIIRSITTLSPLIDFEGNVLNKSQAKATNESDEDKTEVNQDSIGREAPLDTNTGDCSTSKNEEEFSLKAEKAVNDQKETQIIAPNEAIEGNTINVTKKVDLELSNLTGQKEHPQSNSNVLNPVTSKSNNKKMTMSSDEWISKSSQKSISSNSQKSRSNITSTQQSQESQASGWISSQKSTKSSDKLQRKRRRQDDSGWMSTSQKSKSKRKNDESSCQLQIIEENENQLDEINEKQPLKSLPKTEDGWFVAPKGKTRFQFKRDFDDIIEDDGFPGMVESAQTDVCKLVVQQIQIRHPADFVTNPQRKDFKRFRKNSVIAGAKMHSINPITLVSRLPKVGGAMSHFFIIFKSFTLFPLLFSKGISTYIMKRALMKTNKFTHVRIVSS